jgi:hypothetical protein
MQPVPPRSYSDPFAAVSREQRTSLLKQLRNRGDVAELMVDGNKMMWKVLEDGKTIKRLR